MKVCPNRGCRGILTVENSRPVGSRIWRRRQCTRCDKRFTTWELSEKALDELLRDSASLQELRSIILEP